jgi:hypothetical protein
VDLYFDPNAEWPLQGTITRAGTRRVIGAAVCQNPFGESRDADRERVAAIRRTMLSDLAIILGGQAGARRLTGRSPHGAIEINTFHRSGTDQPADSAPQARDGGAPERDPRQPTVAVEAPFDPAAARDGSVLVSRTTRGGIDPLSAAGRPAPIHHDRAPGGERGVPAPGGGTPAAPLRSVRRQAAEARDLEPNW